MDASRAAATSSTSDKGGASLLSCGGGEGGGEAVGGGCCEPSTIKPADESVSATGEASNGEPAVSDVALPALCCKGADGAAEE